MWPYELPAMGAEQGSMNVSSQGVYDPDPTFEEAFGNYQIRIHRRMECTCCHIVFLYKGKGILCRTIRETRVANELMGGLIAHWKTGVKTMARIGTH